MGIDPGYVLDEMEFYEASALFSHRHLRCRESWEQARMLSFVTARCAGAKVKGLKDIFTLPWDEEEKSRLETRPATDEEEARLQAMARYIIQNDLLN